MNEAELEDILGRGSSALEENIGDALTVAISAYDMTAALEAIFRDMADKEIIELVHAVRKETYCHGARAE